MSIQFDHIKLFVKVAECQGFRAASEKLFLSQPAISNAIKKIEAQLGFDLFCRDTYRATLTVQGQAFIKKAKLLVEHMDELENYAQQINDGYETEFTIAIDLFCPLENYLGLFNQLIAQFPQTHFQFYTEALGGSLELLLNNKATIAITENLATNAELEVIQREKIAMLPVATPDYIKQHTAVLFDPIRIKECAQIIIRDSSRLREKFTFGKLKHVRHWTVSDSYSKKQIICSGFGWGRLPDYFIQDEIESGKLIVLKGKQFEPRYLQLSALRLQKLNHGIVSDAVWSSLQ